MRKYRPSRFANPRFRPEVLPLENRATPAQIGSLDSNFNGTGTFSSSFTGGPGTIADAFQAVELRADGGVLAVGQVDGDILLAQFREDGSLDPVFGGGDGWTTFDLGGVETGTGLGLLTDGTIVVGGTTTLNGAVDFLVVKFNSTGSPLQSAVFDFGGGATFADLATSLAINAAAGEIYLVGTHSSFDVGPADETLTNSAVAVVRYSSDLAVLGSRVLGTPEYGVFANTVTVDAFGRVLVAGGRSGAAAITRFNRDLSGADTRTFKVGGDTSVARAVLVSPSGEIYLAGQRNDSYYSSSFFAVRLTDALSELTRGFVSFSGYYDSANAIAFDGQGHIILAGGIDGYPASPPYYPGSPGYAFGVARLHADSLTLDTDFNGTGKQQVNFGYYYTRSAAFDVAVDANKRIVLVGQGDSVPSVARLLGVIPPDAVLVGGPDTGGGLIYPVVDGTLPDPGTSTVLMPGYSLPVRTASADVSGDGIADLIAGAASGQRARVVVTDGRTGAILADFLVFETDFTGGVYVAAADLNGDSYAELVVTADQGGGPRVVVYYGWSLRDRTNTPVKLADFYGLADITGVPDGDFRGGTRPAIGDMNGDNIPELILAAGYGGGPRVTVWDGRAIIYPNGNGQPSSNPLADFFAFEQTLRDGVFVSAGDVNGDQRADLILAGGPGGGPRVRVADAYQLLTGSGYGILDHFPKATIADFFAGDPDSRGGVRVLARDLNSDGLADIVTGSGNGLHSELRVYTSTAINTSPSGPSPAQVLDPFAAILPGGVFVG